MIHIRQEATLLGNGKPQILEVCKNTLPTKLYWVLFPIRDLRQVVETAKRILTKEKIDRQLAGQSLSTPFMHIKNSYNNKKVTFDTQDGLEDKIDRLTVMVSKLAPNNGGTNKQFNPQIYQRKRRGLTRNFYDKHNYDQRNYQNGIDQIVEIEKSNLVVEFSMDKIIEVDQGMNKTIGMTLGEEILEVK